MKSGRAKGTGSKPTRGISAMVYEALFLHLVAFCVTFELANEKTTYACSPDVLLQNVLVLGRESGCFVAVHEA